MTGSKDRLRIQSKFNERVNEVFFAYCVVLTESPGDEMACRCALETLGIEIDRRSISVIALGGKDEIPTFARVLAGFDIPTLALIDEDPGNSGMAKVRTDTGIVLGSTNIFVQVPDLEEMFGLTSKPNRMDAMSLFPKWFGKNAVPQVYVDLVARIKQLVS